MKKKFIGKSSRCLSRFGKLFACLVIAIFSFADKAAADGPWTASTGFTTIQGTNQWYYQQRPRAGGSATNLTWSTSPFSAWFTSDQTGWMSDTDTHPGSTSDTIRKWSAPSSGTVSITGRVFKVDTSGGAGIVASVEKNGTSIWSATVAYNNNTGYTTDASLGAVSISSGDSIAFIVDDNGTYSSDRTGWNPTITKLASYQASTGFSTIQGTNQWYYQQRPRAGGSATNLTWSTSPFSAWFTSDQTGWMSGTDTHPGSTSDTIRKWSAPSSGTVSITGRVFKVDTGGGAGIVASVEQNGTSIWSRTVAYNDPTGYTTDASLGAVSINSGDSIAFIVDDNGTYSNDRTGWDPLISYVAGGPTWMLNTSDTLLTLSIVANQPVITQLKDASTMWNWAPSTLTVPLINTVYISSTAYTPNWTYTTAAVDTTSGTKVTLTFNSTSPSLKLSQCWWARSGGGPVEEDTSITNNSGSTVTYVDSNVVSADLTVTSDNAVTLWRFERASVKNDSSDPNFATGTLKTAMGATTSVSSTIDNTNSAGSYVLPFEMLDVGGVHGLYIGYSCDFGQFTTSTSGNADVVRNVFQLWDGSRNFSQATGTTTAFPYMIYGTYKGDTDTGSNKMKAWFWNNKITPTIKSTTNEPLIEVSDFDNPDGTEAEAISNILWVVTWNMELATQDYEWPDDKSIGAEYSWNPNTTGWPNGMSEGSIVHSHGPKFGLYMANTKDNVDLSTASGVSSEEGSLEKRYNGNQTIDGHFWYGSPGYDYWRTDFNCEADVNYLSHLGFLQVLDYMISNHAGFRWENCSSGGSKKSFDLLQRQSNSTTEDSGYATHASANYRMAYFANSYMINPVQMEAGNWDSPFSSANPYGKYIMRTSFFGSWSWIFGDHAQIPTHVTLYKNYQRPILRGADVYHILPIADYTNWDGLEFFNTTLNKGSVVLLKPSSTVGNSPTIYLKGLVPTNTYSLHFQDRSSLNSSYTSVTGSALMAGGTGIAPFTGSTNDYDSEIIWINY